MTGRVERVAPTGVRVGDTIGSSDGADWLVVSKIRSDLVERETGSARETFRIFTFEDGQEGERVWTFLETDLVARRV